MGGKHGRTVYRTPLWARVRRAVLERDDWTCQSCGCPGTEVHHLAKLEAGGAPYDPANLETLCRGCHLAQHHPKAARRNSAWRKLFDNSLRTARRV